MRCCENCKEVSLTWENRRRLNLDLSKIGLERLKGKLLCPGCYNLLIKCYEFPEEYKFNRAKVE